MAKRAYNDATVKEIELRPLDLVNVVYKDCVYGPILRYSADELVRELVLQEHAPKVVVEFVE